MVVLTDFTVLTLTVWGEQCNNFKLLWKLRQVMIGYALHPDIYNDDTIRGITWIIIRDVGQFFSQSLMQSAFIGNILEVKIAFPTSTLGLLINQMILGMTIRVISITENCIALHIVY